MLIIEDVRIEDGGTYICHASRYTTARAQKNVTLVIECKCHLRLITIKEMLLFIINKFSKFFFVHDDDRIGTVINYFYCVNIC